MKAVILAGGFGKRVRVAVEDVPKPMALIAGKPFLEHQIRLLKDQGIKEIILCVYHMADKIKSYFGNGKNLGVDITYSEEEAPLGTGGAIKRVEKYVNETFIVLNGDSYTQIDFMNFLNFHKEKSSSFTLSLMKASQALTEGNILVENDKIIGFADNENQLTNIISSGVYIFEPRIFSYIPSNKNVSLEREIFPKLAQEGLLFGYFHEGYFMDIGLPETYAKFKQDVLGLLCIGEHNSLRQAIQRIDRTGINVLAVVDDNQRLLGTLTEQDIKLHFLNNGSLDDETGSIMKKKPLTARVSSNSEQIAALFELGAEYIPLIDDSGIIKDIAFYTEEIKTKKFSTIRGRSPLRISFSGGGTDLPYFFDKHGGAVLNATIDKYCYATIKKRADSKVIIDSDLTPETDIIVYSLNDLKYNGNLDLIKAVVNIMKPDFGFELSLYNDVPPGRGLGSSASAAVLVISLLNHLQETNYDAYKIAEIAYRAEREELSIKGGWQDQYAAITGGFNFIEFNGDKTIVYPLRLKEEIINELNHRLLLCYIGKEHNSGEVHIIQEQAFKKNPEDSVLILNEMKKIAIEMKDLLLTNRLDIFGKLLHDSWENKKILSPNVSNDNINRLYEIGLNSGADGGKLLGAGSGGYLLFFYSPHKRNQLTKALQKAGGEVVNFNFEFKGTQIWAVNER